MLFSAKAVLVKLCYQHGADPETVLALRMLFSLPFFWAAVWWYTAARNPEPVQRKDMVGMLALGISLSLLVLSGGATARIIVRRASTAG